MSLLKRAIKKIYYTFFKPSDKPVPADPKSLYGIIGNSITDGLRVETRKPLPGKNYFKIGDHCVISGSFIFESESGEVIIGDRVSIGGSTFISRSKIEIGNDIYIAWGCTIYDHDSHSVDFNQRVLDRAQEMADLANKMPSSIFNKDWSKVVSKPIFIKDHAWIGMNCIILKGVTIGEGSIVGAGSVVSKDVPDWSIVAGNPARVVKEIPVELRNNKR